MHALSTSLTSAVAMAASLRHHMPLLAPKSSLGKSTPSLASVRCEAESSSLGAQRGNARASLGLGEERVQNNVAHSVVSKIGMREGEPLGILAKFDKLTSVGRGVDAQEVEGTLLGLARRFVEVEMRELNCYSVEDAAREGKSEESAAGEFVESSFAVAMACAAVALMFPHEARAGELALAMESGEMLRLSAAEIDPGTAKIAITVLGPLFAAFNLMFIVRIVMSWYPQLPVGKFPFSIAYAPTEPVLAPTRRLIPPVGGVDVSPVIWVALMSFLNEILLGQQGLLVLLSQQQP